MTYYGASELARSLRTVRKNTLAIAEDIPDDKYDYRPTPEYRSVREILAHISVASRRSYQGREMHHRAQLMVVERLPGLVPHLTRQRQARMAQAPAT